LWFAFKKFFYRLESTVHLSNVKLTKLWFAFKKFFYRLESTGVASLPILFSVVICFQKVLL